MRLEHTVQASLFDMFARHEIGRELKAMSARRNEQRELLRLVAVDPHAILGADWRAIFNAVDTRLARPSGGSFGKRPERACPERAGRLDGQGA